jgi:four helix bundle protein
MVPGRAILMPASAEGMTDSTMGDFAKLEVWQRAHRLVLRVYNVTEHFPPSENWGLVAQLRRAAISIPSNIAEGCGRNGDPEMRRFLKIALGSASEVHYQLLLARDLEYLLPAQAEELMKEITGIRGMLHSLIKRLNTSGSLSAASG